MLPILLSDRLSELDEPFDAISREFERILSRVAETDGNKAIWSPYGIDVREDDGHFYVDAELPGFKREECEVTFENGVLHIHGERKEEKTSQKGEPVHIERRWTEVDRAVALPTPVKEDTVEASLDSGVLTVTIDKREEAKPRKIEIGTGSGAAK